MKETQYDLICRLQRLGVWREVSCSCEWWRTRADYLTVYEYILTHEPERRRGFRTRVADALSNKRLGGGSVRILDENYVHQAIREMEARVRQSGRTD